MMYSLESLSCWNVALFLVVFAKIFRVKIWHYVSVAHFLHILYSKHLIFFVCWKKIHAKKRPNYDGKSEHGVTLNFLIFFLV